jgi:hypothetical protein
MESQFETVTRDQARVYLDTLNDHNRPRSATRIRKYAREMREGRWCEQNPHGISFDVTGQLQNGQHTLEALLASGLPSLRLYVHRGCPVSAWGTYDQALPRTAAQILAMSTGQNSGRLSSAARAVLEHGLGVVDPSNSQVAEWARLHQDILEKYLQVHRTYTAGTHAAFVFAELNGWKHVEDAAERLVSLQGNGDHDPMIALARSLRSLGGRDGARSKRTRFYTTLGALQAVSEDRGLDVARKYDAMPARVRESVRVEAAA